MLTRQRAACRARKNTTAQAAAEPVPIWPAHEEGAGDGRSLWGEDRFASRQELGAPPADARCPSAPRRRTSRRPRRTPMAGFEPREMAMAATVPETPAATDQRISEAP